MGAVYAGYDEKLDRKLALKVLHAENRLDDEARERLLREARALSKLDHPNICRIYDYIESSDVDLLVLEYIDGQTLQSLIEAGPVSRAEKLRIASDVARVLVAAHRVGIVHRDLKPDNVMITKAGEVKVLDFGLARWLHVSSGSRLRAVNASEAVSVPVPMDSNNLWFPVDDSSLTVAQARATPSAGRFAGTEVGMTMGTPLYMSPEQARGETLTTASDLFSFGLLLQFLFTGNDPHPHGLSAREVILRAARGETMPANDVPGDVAALIGHLKQFAPADRPTAVEAVARLHHLSDKTRRIVRRSAIAATIFLVVLGIWRYTVDLSRARADAEKRRAQAEDLINFMVGDLRTKLEAVQRLEVLDDVAEKALQYVGSSNPETATAEELVAQVQALNQLGEVRALQGNLAGAVTLFEQSLARAGAAVRRHPKNDEAKYVQALSHFWIANSHRLQADPARGLEHARRYLAITSDLTARNPANDKYVLESAYAHSQVGMLLEDQRDLKGAIAEYRVALAIKEAHAARHPGDDTAKEDTARTMNKLAFAVQKDGDLQSALRTFEDEVKLRQELVRRNPKQVRWKQDLAVSHTFVSALLEDLGETAAAIEHRREDVRLHGELAAYDASNTTWQRNLGRGRSQLGRKLGLRGEYDEALAHLRGSEETLRALLAVDPKRTAWRGDYGRAQVFHATVLLARGDVVAARRKVDEAIATCGTDSANRAILGHAHLVRGAVLESAQQPAAAREAWLQAAELLRPSEASSSNARELDNWARVLMALDRRDEATAVAARLRALGFQKEEFQVWSRSRGY